MLPEKKRLHLRRSLLCCLSAAWLSGCSSYRDTPFESASDIGRPRHRGAMHFNRTAKSYLVSGGGANMWASTDQFYFLRREASGDLFLESRISFPEKGGDPHRKAGLMLRSTLAADAAHVGLLLHGDGLIALQFRRTAGGPTEEVRAVAGDWQKLRLERHGSVVSAHLVGATGRLYPVASFEFALPDTLYAGLAVCAHDNDRIETALFSETEIRSTPTDPGADRGVESSLEILNLTSGRREVVYRSRDHFEAPNWHGDRLVFNQAGRLYALPDSGGAPQLLDTGFADRCNNDHGFSADGKWLAISHEDQGLSKIYVLPAGGGEPRLVTPLGPSYWHGWSPDSLTLVYCARRNDEYDVYAIPVHGGAERRLTTSPGLDDGPEYSPDGRSIYFNSDRTGVMKIYRMRPDGSDQQQITSDEAYADWFAHPSPDGRWLVFLSYDRSVRGHPANRNVVLRLMPATGGPATVIAVLFGGQGSINVPCWSADSRKFAFCSYRPNTPKS